jgi:gamma-glutamylcyclotransferase (GGCT)/AIG2-like uncharacterized protein YtfP
MTSPSPELCDLFVYGTLLYPEVVYALTGESLRAAPARLPDYQRFAVRPPGRSGRGPVIFPEPGGVVEGGLLRNVSAAARELIDRFEAAGGGYQRCQVMVQTGDGEPAVPAWAYVGEEQLREHRVGTWSIEDFEGADLQWYLTERLPSLRREWGLPPTLA